MHEGCPCGRRCTDCPYEEICGGCIEERCIHRRNVSKDHSCLFSDIHNIPCVKTLKPPSDFELARPEMLEDAVNEFRYSDVEIEPEVKNWPLLIPEISQISSTTARLGVWPDEGKWSNPLFDPIAWDLTGNLFDKPMGAPWTFEPQDCKKQDWRNMLGPEKNWIHDVLLIDRLPDYLALQTPPTAAIMLYLNRLQVFIPSLLHDEDAPYPWLVTHGYPSYTNWPPAWHFNLGIRMLSSLLAYLINQEDAYLSIEPGALYPDRSRRTTQPLPLPYLEDNDEIQLLWTPDSASRETTNMEWPRFPGIIPFIPGADVAQIIWFGGMMHRAGFKTFAIDGLNSIAHENYRGINESVAALRSNGADKVLLYGPWPLHIPSSRRPIHGISYIPSAVHMDMTDSPPRYWRAIQAGETPQGDRKVVPSYKDTKLGDIISKDWLASCNCKACNNAKAGENHPRGIWRWGHLLQAGFDWAVSVQDISEHKGTAVLSSNECLWFNGPSNTTFRCCLSYPDDSFCDARSNLIDSLVIDSTHLRIRLPEGAVRKAHEVRWGTKIKLYKWASNFPELGE